MSEEIFELLSELELQIVSLYKKVMPLSRFLKFKETFQLMADISQRHSEIIKEMGEKYTIPNFERNAVKKMHDQMKTKLFNSIVHEQDEDNALKTMAKSEEDVGKLYQAISNYFENLSEYYKNISIDIKSISEEEFNHRDGLLKLLER